MSMSKVKDQGHQGQKRAVHSEHPRRVNGMERLVADKVAQAVGAATRSLKRGVFAGLCSACGGLGGLPLGSAAH